MDLLPIGFLLVIVIVSGAIAYAADHVGKKLGKKRLSIAGLRPRHTAALGTILLGVTVSLLTIIFVSVLSLPVRQWIFEGNKAIRERDRLLGEIGDFKKQSDDAKLGYQKQLGDSKRLEKTIQENKLLLNGQTQKIKELQALKDGLEGKVGNLKKQIQSVREALSHTKGLLAKSDFALFAAEKQRKELQASIKIAEANLGETNKQLNESKKDAAALDYQVQTIQSQIEEQKKDLAKQNEQLTDLLQKKAELETAKKRTEQELAATQANLEQSKRDLENVRQAFLEAQSQLSVTTNFISSTFGPSRFQRLIFNLGEEMARLPVRANPSREEAQNALTTLMRMSRVVAEERGARSHVTKDRTYEIADLYPLPDPKTKQMISVDELKEIIIQNLMASKQPTVLLATSSLNAFRGESVSIDVDVQLNPVIYKLGQIVAETRIDGRRSEAQVFADVTNFLRTQLQEKARKDHMIPRTSGDEAFGSVSIGDLLQLNQEILSTHRIVRLEARAIDDTRAADQLRLEFRVK